MAPIIIEDYRTTDPDKEKLLLQASLANVGVQVVAFLCCSSFNLPLFNLFVIHTSRNERGLHLPLGRL